MIPVFATDPATAAEAQRRRVFEAALNLRGFMQGGVVEPVWLPDGSGFLHTVVENGVREIRRVDAATGRQSPLFDSVAVARELERVTGMRLTGTGLPFDMAVPAGGNRFLVSCEGRQLEIDVTTSGVTPVAGEGPLEALAPNSETNRRRPRMFDKPLNLVGSMPVLESPSPDGRWFAFLRGKNVWVRSTLDNRERQLTHDGGGDIDWDMESQRQHIGPDMSIAVVQRSGWSPNSARLFAIRSDRAGVFRVPSVHFLKRFEEVTFIPYPKAGTAIERTRPCIVDVLGDRVVPLQLDRPEEQYLLFCAWLSDSRTAFFMRVDRRFKQLEIFRCDAATGEARCIVEESCATFIRLQHEFIYSGVTGFTLLPDESGFLLLSERDGWAHLYRYDLDGRLLNRITSGDYPVVSVIDVDRDSGRVLFWANHDPQRPYDLHICSAHIAGGEARRLTEAPGQHRARLSPDGTVFLDIHSSVDRYPQTDLRGADGRLIATIARADVTALEALRIPPAEEFTVTAADGSTVLWGVLYKPFDFDPRRHYPVVEYIYGGPNLALVRHNSEPGYGEFNNHVHALAHLGFITVVLDARGTPRRSKAFHDVVHGRWGRHEIADHAGALRQLAARFPWLDLARVGIYGHSWGGHFATRALAEAPDIYRVGVASAPGYDPYDANIYEPYIGQPQEVREAYEFANPVNLAPRIQGRLMIIAGSSDHGVYSSVMKMVEGLVRAGVDHDLVILPGEGHGYLGSAGRYALRRITQHFITHLQPALAV